ncbi:glycosyltransferase family 4 protein [bacterium]|nr:glycosyltransferase family 4 protein [bacterium]
MANVGIVTTWFERGAAYVSRQYERLIAIENKVYIYARGGYQDKRSRAYNKENVWWGKVTGRPIRTAIDKADFIKWISLNKIDIVLFNEQSWWEPVVWCKEEGVITGSYIDYYTHDTVPLFWLYDFLLCNTKRHYSVFKEHPQSYHIPWGVDTNLFAPAKEADHEIPVLFHSCGVSPYRKGTDMLLNAASRISGDFKLVVHTQVSLSKISNMARSAISKLSKAGRLQVIRKTIPAPGLYSSADIYVYPSRLDGLGLTLPEAISSGLAVVATGHPPMSEFVRSEYGVSIPVERSFRRGDGYYWQMVEVKQEILTSVLQELINDKDKIVSMKRSAREYAVRFLNWDDRATSLNDTLGGIEKIDYDQALVERALEYEAEKSTWKDRLYHIMPEAMGQINIIKKRIAMRKLKR